MAVGDHRRADHPIDPQFLERWSPRAFSDAPLSPDQLLILLEAARWAPSAFNSQPWRFVYAFRDGPGWPALLDALVPFNRQWAGRAGALVAVASKTTMLRPGQSAAEPSHSHSFDAGAAWGYLALQAARLGLAAHAMTGVDFQAAGSAIGLPADHRLEAVVAIGAAGEAQDLPDFLQAREAPSPRAPLATFAFETRFPPDE
ncbi:nitroreductase family protein [Caulobacter hibisci]|uniref:Nitroreductase family protein n=1 Tax=Caulobacter hibisci TaxID=2035993 RepID=A0ABS0SZR9_9CAUL|nr:nitroreductase family protein [Caulobacter hibisci]MBI1684082.1 nitroreductase family protein [Caulobacter hibisci]